MAHYLITGHTGFKGAWLTLLLKARGHEVSGLALDPPEESLFVKAGLADELVHDFRVDIRNRDATREAIQTISPDFVIHMAAQALVREGYRRPVETYDTNVVGTMNVLLATDATDSVQAQLIVTTDKVYEDRGYGRPYVETDPLGGKDPYSVSKAMADLLAQEWLARPGSKPGAVARAGNVIGAGDYSVDRLIPDILRAAAGGTALKIRYPEAIRPWQHVLDCLAGYLVLLDTVVTSGARGAWNFGPAVGQLARVDEVLSIIAPVLGVPVEYPARPSKVDMPEDLILALDASKSRIGLQWEPLLELEDSLLSCLAPRLELADSDPGIIVRKQIEFFERGGTVA
jgi:CDP-glucose 4,6-dehydratase